MPNVLYLLLHSSADTFTPFISLIPLSSLSQGNSNPLQLTNTVHAHCKHITETQHNVSHAEPASSPPAPGAQVYTAV